MDFDYAIDSNDNYWDVGALGKEMEGSLERAPAMFEKKLETRLLTVYEILESSNVGL